MLMYICMCKKQFPHNNFPRESYKIYEASDAPLFSVISKKNLLDIQMYMMTPWKITQITDCSVCYRWRGALL